MILSTKIGNILDEAKMAKKYCTMHGKILEPFMVYKRLKAEGA